VQRLTVVNPGFVLGPTLDGKTDTSLDVIKLIMKGAYPAVPPAHYPVIVAFKILCVIIHYSIFEAHFRIQCEKRKLATSCSPESECF